MYHKFQEYPIYIIHSLTKKLMHVCSVFGSRSVCLYLCHCLQLKSVVRCKVCNYKSVRFDPFTFLSLPLPMDSTTNIETIG